VKARILRALAPAVLLAATLRGAETFDDAMKRAAADYGERLKTAADELNTTRKRIADEKAPLLQDMRAAEDRILMLQSEIGRMEAGQEDSSNQRRKQLTDLDGVRKNTTYLGTLAHDGLSAYGESLSPGEGQLLTERVEALGQKLDDVSSGPGGGAAMDIADFLLERTRRELGGYAAAGSSLVEGNSQVFKGTFAFIGPETYFLPDGGGKAGTVRPRAGSVYPVTYPLDAWKPDEAAAFFQGRQGTIIADASGGKALRLRETTGSLGEHIQKGGLVAYAIIGVGILSLLMIPHAVKAFLAIVSRGETAKAEQAAKALLPPTRELFEVGLKYSWGPREILEEHLQSVLLRQSLHFERRLPLLAVIATAAPLMGLLGTVVGMVKTFALITVFGTGNAGKLASGISEVLVATELGLIVAIPTLIAHGFLAHRIQRNLSMLERYALEFVTAAEAAKSAEKTVPA
jgi:biopolymer transport protein ExbB